MIRYHRVGSITVVTIKCDDCVTVSPPTPVSSADEEEQALEASRALRPLGWDEKIRRPGASRPFIASLCPKCSGWKPPSTQLGLKLS